MADLSDAMADLPDLVDRYEGVPSWIAAPSMAMELAAMNGPSLAERVAMLEKRWNTHSTLITTIAAKLGVPLPESQEGGEDAR